MTGVTAQRHHGNILERKHLKCNCRIQSSDLCPGVCWRTFTTWAELKASVSRLKQREEVTSGCLTLHSTVGQHPENTNIQRTFKKDQEPDYWEGSGHVTERTGGQSQDFVSTGFID